MTGRASTIDNPKALACAFTNARLFASSDELRPVLCCVAIEAAPRRIRFLATDSYVLLVQELALTNAPRLGTTGDGEIWRALIDRDDLRIAGAALRGLKDTPVELERVDDGVALRVADREVIVPHSSEGDFPDVDGLLNDQRGKVDELTLSSHTVRRVASLKVPSYNRDSVPYEWVIGGARRPVRFRITPADPDLEVYGALMPTRTD